MGLEAVGDNFLSQSEQAKGNQNQQKKRGKIILKNVDLMILFLLITSVGFVICS